MPKGPWLLAEKHIAKKSCQERARFYDRGSNGLSTPLGDPHDPGRVTVIFDRLDGKYCETGAVVESHRFTSDLAIKRLGRSSCAR